MQEVQNNMFPIGSVADTAQIWQRLLWGTRLAFHTRQQVT